MIQWNKCVMFAVAYRKIKCILLLVLYFCCCCLISGQAHFFNDDQNLVRAIASPFLVPPSIEHFSSTHTRDSHVPQKELTHVVKELTAAEVMVDVSNDLTYRILHYHSILNRNNFAFSPSALMSVMVALYEGSEGPSAKEIKDVLQLPNNRDVIRVGYRDIHRRLRTYFFDAENPLKGLCMNRANITIAREYENVLKFYGYELNMDMVSFNLKNQTKVDETSTETIIFDTTKTPIITQMKILNSTNTSSTTKTISTTTSPTTITTPTQPATRAESQTTAEDVIETTEEQEQTTPTESSATEATTTETVKEAEELISAFVAEENAEPLRLIQKARVVRLPDEKLKAPPRIYYLPQSTRKLSSKSNTARNKRHLFGDLRDFEAELLLSAYNLESLKAHYKYPDLSVHYTDFLTSHKGNQKHQEQQHYNTDVINHVFYLNDQDLIHTTFKVYNAVLYYKYYQNLRMNVLELELDSQQYNLMILLPDFHNDLVTASATLRLAPTLREMRKQLKPRWVQAIIPDFHLHGNIFLTNDLQNLGLCNIFEPNRADLRPMTDESGVYVKHIEQSINVHIRTHPINQNKRNYGSQTQPIQLSVNHPFMFVIIDRDLDIAVMAGRVLNPLNVRIQ